MANRGTRPMVVAEFARPHSAAARRAVDEYELAYGSAVNALEHAIACGEILLEIQADIPAGKWGKWCADNVPEINLTTVTKFCRLAQYRDQLDAGGFTTIDRAMGHLRALAIPRRPGGPMRRARKLDVDEARRLHREGMNYVQIAEVFDVSDTTVAIHLDPKRRAAMQERERAAKRRRTAARQALRQAERDEAVRAKGGTAAEGYAALRRTALVIDRAITETADPATRSRLTAALGFCHRAEDEIVAALQIERTH